MAQKPNKKAQGKPVYKQKQPAAQASETVKSEAPPTSVPAPNNAVNWQQMFNATAAPQQTTSKPAAKPVDFASIHSGANSATQPAFQSAPAEAPESEPYESQGQRQYPNKNNYQQRNNNDRDARPSRTERRTGGPQGQGHVKGKQSYGGGQGERRGPGGQHGDQQQRYQNNRGGNNNYQNQQQNFYQNPQAVIGGMTPQMLANQPQMVTHTQNMQHMELSEIESLFTSICSQLDPELLQATLSQAGMPLGGGRPGAPQMPRPQNQRGGKNGPNNQYQQRNDGSNQGRGGRGGKYQQAAGSGRGPMMPMPGGPKGQGGFQKMDSGDFPSLGAGGNQKMVYQAKKARRQSDYDGEDMPQHTDMQGSEEMKSSGQNQQSQQPFFTNAVQMNLCQVHFPEPIMMFKEKPLCKICIQEQFTDQAAQYKKMGAHTQNAMSNARMLGIAPRPMNMYQSEKQKITRSVQRLDNFKKQFRYIEDDIKQREQMSAEHMKILTPLMNSMMDKLEELQVQGEQKFKNKIFQIVRNQQKNIQDDMKIKLPQFYNRLQQKYGELQQASNLAQQRGAQELIETLKHFQTIFIQLDSEYEKYFNDYEKMSKLQRLLDKDANEIVRDFTDMVERNLRVDYNIKSSFGPQYPQRLHSFQWNQKCVQLYKLKTGQFEKKPVQMTYDVPLYSRSIATETGTIYLTGGYVKHMGVYLKNCYRYDDLFGILNQVSHMNYPHADHSICTIQNFIYVIGTFVGNQVYGYCEVYDTQKDKWKLIADMRVPRTGTSLCVFKNNYIFAFGGRVDQKRIVDTIEVYDISRNVWQEIGGAKCDKTNWVPSYMGLAHQITDNEIILFGGKSAATFHIFNGCFVFDVEKMEIRERGSLVNPCSFMNTPLVFNSNLYAYGNDIYVHQYNIPEQKWSVIPKSGVVLPKA